MATVINSLWVVPNFDKTLQGGFSVHWTISTNIPVPLFVPEYSSIESGEVWTPVVDSPISSMSVNGVGPKKISFSSMPFFRIKVYDSEDNSLKYTSTPETVKVGQNQHDFLIWREILRRENLGQTKYNGVKGWLLRRREVGAKCTNCIDEILGAQLKSDCPVCYGTGYLSGYFTPQLMYGDWQEGPPYSTSTKLEAVGPSQVRKTVIMTTAFPETNFKDVWVDASTNFRYEIQEQRKNQFRGWPINQMLTLSILPPSDPAYRVSVPAYDPSTPGSVSY